MSIVLLGSLARYEFTPGSDIDWFLLIDSRVDRAHHKRFQEIRDIISKIVKKPVGREGIFGQMVFSHDLVHIIGGQKDKDLNLTRRLTLLLEARVMGNAEAYNRVLNHILGRYLDEDRHLWGKDSEYRIPKFLLNDFIRFWRTMNVDLCDKTRERSGIGSPIRELKLEMSRKSIYVSSLLLCFYFHTDFTQDERERLFEDQNCKEKVFEYMKKNVQKQPLEIITSVLLRYRLNDVAGKIMDSYNEFMRILANSEQREKLENMRIEDLRNDAIYQDVGKLATTFHVGLIDLLCNKESGLADLMKKYVMF